MRCCCVLGAGKAANAYDYDQAMVFEKAKKEGFDHAFARAFGSKASGVLSKRVRIPYP